MAQSTGKSAREASLERRRALTTQGKKALKGAQASRTNTGGQKVTTVVVNQPKMASSMSGRDASKARRNAMSNGGKKALSSSDRIRTAPAKANNASAETVQAAPEATKTDCGCGCNGAKATTCGSEKTSASSTNNRKLIVNKKRQVTPRSAARIASLARRAATSTRGKAGINKGGLSSAESARASNPDLSSREIAAAVREARSRAGKTGQQKSEPCGRRRAKKSNQNNDIGAAKDQPWKVGASETIQGQTLTGTMVGRSNAVTGDEASTCRDVTGTEYMGADVFRDFCKTDPKPTSTKKVTVTSTSHGNQISGDREGRGLNVTGNEAGTCKNVTGDEYISAEQSQSYCAEFASKSPRKITVMETNKGLSVSGDNVGRSEKVTGDESGMERTLTGTQYTKPQDIGNAPAKVGKSETLRGGSITGTLIGRKEQMTGDEAGSCRNITGDDYVGKEQYNGFCDAKIDTPTDKKVGVSATAKGLAVTGTMTGRTQRVTGDEPGSCKAVTGTPYNGKEQVENFCQAEDAAMAEARTQENRATPAMPLTGIQPGVGGVMTGADKGACEAVSGTPYVGADQFAEACPATAATSVSPDFPKPIGGEAVAQQFTVNTPSGGASALAGSTGVTGQSSTENAITGPFGMANGKVTGTEDARFDSAKVNAPNLRPEPVTQVDGREKSRISGEGQSTGLTITGDDWGRGEHVTGTEGFSSTKRNPTIRANNSMQAMQEMAALAQKRNEEIALPNSKITGSSGNTDKGSLITYSGGARG